MPRAVQRATAAEDPYSMSSGWATTHSTRWKDSSGSGGSVMATILPPTGLASRPDHLAVVDRDLAVIDLCAVGGRDDGGARFDHRRSTVPGTQLSTLFERNAEFVRSGAGARRHVP